MMCGTESHHFEIEDRDIIDGNRRLRVRKVAEKWGVSKTTVRDILSQDLICARWVSRPLTRENLEKESRIVKSVY